VQYLRKAGADAFFADTIIMEAKDVGAKAAELYNSLRSSELQRGHTIDPI
jgi:hypothetical protein